MKRAHRSRLHPLPHLFDEVCQPPAFDRRPCARGQVEQEGQVMQGEQAEPEDLLLVDEVADIGAREAGARGTAAVLVERPLVAAKPGVPEVQAAVAR